MRSFMGLSVLFLAASLLFYKPQASTDLGSLIPVETLWVTREWDGICVEGKDVKGVGADWDAAMADLEATADGDVFLETVDRVIVAEAASVCLETLRADLRFRPAVQLYLLKGAASEKLERFTSAHESAATIGNGEALPVIYEEGGRYRLG